jgi:ribosomal protein S13
MNMDLDPCLARKIKMADITDEQSADIAAKIIATVGSSHSNNVAAALDLDGSNIVHVTDRKCQLSAENVTKAVESINAMEHRPDLILVQALDSRVYLL